MNANDAAELAVTPAPSETLSPGDLIDRIAKRLPDDVRADYYRLLLHCRSLPGNDELLCILNAMQFLTLLTVEVPDHMLAEREKVEASSAAMMKYLERSLQSVADCQRQFDQWSAGLPAEIANRLSSDKIVAAIHESVQQQFARAMLPQTMQALAVIAAELNKITLDFGERANRLTDAHKEAAGEVQRASTAMAQTSSHAIETVQREAERLSRRYEWPLYVFASLALVIAFVLGGRFRRWFDSPAVSAEQPAVLATPLAPPVGHGGTQTKARR